MTKRNFQGSPTAPGRRWAFRGALAALTLFCAGLSLADTLANVIGRGSPSLAYQVSPWDGRAAGSLAEQTFAMSPTGQPDSEATRLARGAVGADATAVSALNVLALQAQLRGDATASRAMFSQSLSLSRRELQQRIWAIEEAVNRGDIQTALRNHDLALRTSRRAPDLLFPVLANAIMEPRVRPALLELVASEPPWADELIYHMAASGAEARATLLFIQQVSSRGVQIGELSRTALINRLVSSNNLPEAWAYYASFRDDSRRAGLRDGDFEAVTDMPTAFDWQLANSDGVAASVQTLDGRTILEYVVLPGNGGVIVQQALYLPAGTYRLEGEAKSDNSSNTASAAWELTCIDGPSLGRILLAPDGAEWFRFNGTFSVPSGCSGQSLALVGLPTAELAGLNGQVRSVRLSLVANSQPRGN